MVKSLSLVLITTMALAAWASADDSEVLLRKRERRHKQEKHENIHRTIPPCHCCKEFGLFFQKNSSTAIATQGNKIPVSFDTNVFSSKDIQLDPSSGSILITKPGFYFLEYAVNVNLPTLGNFTEIAVDAFVTLNNFKILGSGSPQRLFFPGVFQFTTITGTAKIKVCKDCSKLQLWVLNNSGTDNDVRLGAPDPSDVLAVLDLIYLGGLDCVCSPCNNY